MNELIITEMEKLVKYMETEFLLLNIEGEVDKIESEKYRLLANKKILNILKNLDFKINSSKDLHGIAGISIGTYNRVDEILKTGKLSEIGKKYTKKKINKIKGILELFKISGIGDKMVKKLILEDGIRNISDLRKAINNGKVVLNRSAMLGIKYIDVTKTKIPRQETKHIENYLSKMLHNFNKSMKLEICGSYRRGKAFSGDIDVLLFHPKIKTIEQFENNHNRLMEQYIDLLKLDGFILDDITDKDYYRKYMGYCKYKKYPIRRIDIRFIPYNSRYTARIYFTGPYELNQILRNAAKKRDMKLNEYGLYHGHNIDIKTAIPIKIKSEKDIFNLLGMDYVEPENRDIFSSGK